MQDIVKMTPKIGQYDIDPNEGIMEKKTNAEIVSLRADPDIERLEGLVLGEWRVIERCPTGERTRHSVGYKVQHQDGRLGHLKALDFNWYLVSDNPLEVATEAGHAYLDELRLLELAKARKFGHVVRVYGHGVIRRSTGIPIQYLIAELAESDARTKMYREGAPPDAQAIRVAHNAATGSANCMV
jgi:hypothetical protein